MTFFAATFKGSSMRSLPSALALALALALSTPAFAEGADPVTRDPALSPELRAPGGLLDASPKVRQPMASVFLGFPQWWYGFYAGPVGLSGRFTFPLLHNGLLPGVNDSLGLDVGVDLTFLMFRNYGTVFDIPAELMWSLHFVPRVAGYVKLGLALEMNFGTICYGPNSCVSGTVGLVPVGAAGLSAQLTPGLVLRVEAGYPWVKIGIGVPL